MVLGKKSSHSLSLFSVQDFFYKFETLPYITSAILDSELRTLYSRNSLGTINQLEEYFIHYFPRFWISNVLSPRYYDVQWRNKIFALAERILFLKCLIIKYYFYKLDRQTIKFYNAQIRYIRRHQKLQTGQVKDEDTGKYKKIKVKSAFNVFKIDIDEEDALVG